MWSTLNSGALRPQIPGAAAADGGQQAGRGAGLRVRQQSSRLGCRSRCTINDCQMSLQHQCTVAGAACCFMKTHVHIHVRLSSRAQVARRWRHRCGGVQPTSATSCRCRGCLVACGSAFGAVHTAECAAQALSILSCSSASHGYWPFDNMFSTVTPS